MFPFQERLTRSRIIPHLAPILHDFFELREAIDRAADDFAVRHYGIPLANLNASLSSNPAHFHGKALEAMVHTALGRLSRRRLSGYPLGECATITKIAWRFLQEESRRESASPSGWVRKERKGLPSNALSSLLRQLDSTRLAKRMRPLPSKITRGIIAEEARKVDRSGSASSNKG